MTDIVPATADGFESARIIHAETVD